MKIIPLNKVARCKRFFIGGKIAAIDSNKEFVTYFIARNIGSEIICSPTINKEIIALYYIFNLKANKFHTQWHKYDK